MPWVVLCLLSVCLGGCIRGGTAQTVFSLGTAAFATDDLQPKACLFVLGTIGPFRGMQMVVAHGGVTLQECMALHGHVEELP